MGFLYVTTPDGAEHRHIETAQTPSLEVETTEDGSVCVLSVRESRAITRPGMGTIRPASRSVELLRTYPPGSTWEWR